MIGPQLQQANPCLKMGSVSSVATVDTVDFPWLGSDRINIWAWVKFFSRFQYPQKWMDNNVNPGLINP